MMDPANKFVRNVSHTERSPALEPRFFFTSPYAIDDPLSPLPPASTTAKPGYQQPPRPFSSYDHTALEEAWLRLRAEIQKVTKEGKPGVPLLRKDSSEPRPIRTGIESRTNQLIEAQRHARGAQASSHGSGSAESTPASSIRERGSSLSAGGQGTVANPFIRAPSRKKLDIRDERSASRPRAQAMDSYEWDEETHPYSPAPPPRESPEKKPSGPGEKVAVGVSRLHEVVMPELRMEPIYWSPLNDAAPVIRATWFYKDNLLPVEADVANMLEAGYVALQPWTQTWREELDSAVELGALGEEKIVHKLWPDKPPSRPSTARDSVSNLPLDKPDPEKERKDNMDAASALIDAAAGSSDIDNKAGGTATYGHDGRARQYLQSGVIYANKREAYLLRPNLQPSSYYGRKPLASYIRKGRNIGIAVVRGFDSAAWEKMYPPKNAAQIMRAMQGTSSAEAGAPPKSRRKSDAKFSLSERPQVTDLVLVIHGIGQKLSEKVESYHFTFAMNAFRREVNVELGSDAVKPSLRKNMGGIMVLPVNWRLGLSFEDGGYRDGPDALSNQYSLEDITPDTLPSIRSVVGDVMLDIPYYLSQEHNPKMVKACIKEANRIYRLWCANNPGFAQHGRVHLIAHSLGSVMAFDILSSQPTHVDRSLAEPSTPGSAIKDDHFLFDTSSVFTIGSPIGFFLLLRRAALLPRKGHKKDGVDNTLPVSPGVAGEQGNFGCLAVDNIYNVINGYDPIAYRVNAAFDSSYSKTLKKAFLPSATQGYRFSNLFSSARDPPTVPDAKPHIPRMPSNVELETHNFTLEEIAEERAYLLNDNGQVDWYMRYGGGPLEIQYLTMLSAHSSYWLSRDFVRMLVIEIGRAPGREGTIPAMRAVKKKPGDK